MRTGRWGGASPWLYRTVCEIEASLREMGISEDQLREARKDFVAYTKFDAASVVMGSGRIAKELVAGAGCLERGGARQRANFRKPTPCELKRF